MPTVSIPMYQTIYRLGTLYSSYRLVIALSLTLIYFLTLSNQASYYEYPQLYFYSLLSYIAASLLQALYLKYIPHLISKQILSLFAIDLIFLSSLTFALGGPNISIGLLFVVSVFAANFLLTKNQALFITLVSVICVVYQKIFGILFTESSLNHIDNSALLAFLFFVVHAIGQISIKRFQVLESLNMHQSNELFKLQNINRYILEQIEVGYLVLDEQCKIIVSNPAACSLLGISPLYAHEQFHLATFQPDLFSVLKHKVLANSTRFQFESTQSSYVVDVRVQNLIVPNQSLTLLILEDTQKLNQKAQQLKLAALGQLSASIAHEIRNPLATIIQANELNQSDDPEQKMLNNMISKQAHRINHIIKNTLDLASNKKTDATTIEINDFLVEMIEQDLSDIKAKIRLELEKPYLIVFDPSQLIQVLVNLIRNAVRHNAIEAEHILIKTSLHKNLVYIDVIDYGKGVKKHDLSQLFQPFFSTEINGTGLGLYLSHSICQANDAQLSYVEQDRGACFRIECHHQISN